MSNIFNLSNIFAESSSSSILSTGNFSNETHIFSAMRDLKGFNSAFMENTTNLYKSISEAEDTKSENNVFCQYFEEIDSEISKIIKNINDSISRFTINVDNIVDANKDILDNTSIITSCKPFTYHYTQYKRINDKDFPAINAIGIFKQEFDYIALTLQELGPTASNQSKLKVIATVYNKFVKSTTDVTKKCILDVLGEDDDDDDDDIVSEFPEKMYGKYKKGADDVEITKGKLYDVKMSLTNYRNIIDSCSQTADDLIKQLSSISAEIKRIICGNSNNTLTVKTSTDGIRDTDYRMDSYAMNQVDIFLKAKINQVIQIANVYYIALAIKLDATMDYFKQCKDILTVAMTKCGESETSEAEKDAQNDVDDDGEIEVDDHLDDKDAFTDDDKGPDDDNVENDVPDDDSEEKDSDDSSEFEKDDENIIDTNDEDNDGIEDSAELEDLDVDGDNSDTSDDDESSDNDSLKDLDEAEKNLEESLISFEYKQFYLETMYDYVDMLDNLVSIMEADEDNNQQQNQNDAKGTVRTAVNTAKTQTNASKGRFQGIKNMINKLIELIQGKFTEAFNNVYKNRIEELKKGAAYINIKPVDYQNENGDPVGSFDVNLGEFDKLEVPRFDANMIRNIKDKDDFIKNTLKVDIIKDGDKELSIGESIERKVISTPSRLRNFNQVDLKSMYNWCINYEKVVSDIQEWTKLLENGIKNAERISSTLKENTGSVSSLEDTLLNYFGEANIPAAANNDNKDGDNGGGNNAEGSDLEKVEIYFNCSKDVITAKMRLAQKIFKEYYQLCMFQINTMKNRTGNNKGEEQNQNK